MQRLLINVALGLSIIFLPWWIATVLVLVLLLYCDGYEVIVWGLVADGLYAVPAPALGSFEFALTAGWTALLCASLVIKPHLIFYAQR
jgi:hypothetical protein